MFCEKFHSSLVIESFGDDVTAALWRGEKTPELPSTILKNAQRKLTQLEAATRLDDMKVPPGNRLKALKGGLKGMHSIRINDQFRVVFRWEGSNAYEVIITDYH